MKLRALFLRARRNKERFFFKDLSDSLSSAQKFSSLRFFSTKTTRFVLFFLLIPGAFLSAQKITISKTNVPIQAVFTEIEKQSNYQFFYNENILQKASAVSIDVKNASIEETLKNCFRNQPITY